MFSSNNLIPKLSILVPVYNEDEYLLECLESLEKQTLKGIQIILINDGSSNERTLNILDKFNKKNPNSRLLHKENTGYGHSLNIGMAAADGEYIGIVESDDFIHPQMYEILYTIAKSWNLDLVKSDLAFFIDYKGQRLYERGKVHKNRHEYNRVLNLQGKQEVFRDFSINQSGIYRKGFLQKENIKFNESPGASYQDNGFFFQLMMNADKIFFYDFPLYFLRRDNLQSSVNNREKVHVIFHEYSFIENIITANLSKFGGYLPGFYWKKFNSYFFNLKRIAYQHKPTFIKRFAEEFREYQNNNCLDLSLFTDREKNILYSIINAPEDYLQNHLEDLAFKNYLEKQKKAVDQGLQKIDLRKFNERFTISTRKIPTLSIYDRINLLFSKIFSNK